MPIYREIYDGPPRGYTKTYTKKKYIAIHNTSNNASAENEAAYAKRRTDSVSSHYYVDSNSIVQSLNTDYRAWHAGSTNGNSYAIAYEIVGTNAKSRDWWLKNVDWDKLAKQIARDMKQWGIKNEHLTVQEIKDGKKTGIITHDDMRRAWGGTTHTDPGGNFPMDHLLKKVTEALEPKKEETVSDTDIRVPYIDQRVYALAKGYDEVPEGKGFPRAGEQIWLVTAVKELTSKVDNLVDSIKVAPEGVTVNVEISDEQLERVIRKVLGSLDQTA